MRSKFILTLLILAELFLVLLLCSPGVWKSKRRILAESAWAHNPTPETEQAFYSERNRECIALNLAGKTKDFQGTS